MLILNFLLIFTLDFYQCKSVTKELMHVHILYRHGDRAPIKLYPTDKNREDKWPNGMAYLTNQGIIQHFNLGMWLRRRYNDFLGTHLNYSLIHVRSTNIDRTLMSAQANLAGMFYNVSEEVIKGFKWHPIPVHTVERKSDILLEGDSCPFFKAKLDEVSNMNYYKMKFQPYQGTLELLRKKTETKINSFMDVWSIHDSIFCEKANNLTVDDWITNEVWKNITEINNIIWEVRNYGELPKIVTGYLLKKITEYLKSFIGSERLKEKGLKMVIYSGHDTDVAPLSALLGIYDYLQPPYTACIMIELYYLPLEKEKWAIQAIYKNYTDSSGITDIPVSIIPGCDQPLCPLTKFLQLMKSKILSREEYNKICKSSNNILIIVQVIFGIVAIFLILLIIFMFSFRILRKPGLHRYSKIGSNQSIN